MYETIIILLIAMLCYVIYVYSIKNKEIKKLELNLANLINQSQQRTTQYIEKLKYREESIEHLKLSKESLLGTNRNLREAITTLESTFESAIKEAVVAARKDSVKRQRSILKGQATEHLAPYIRSDYSPKDYRFFGDPIDFIIFDGMHNFKETKKINKIIFMDIKTGTANLTTLQRRIRDAIKENRVEFEVYNPEKDIKRNDEQNEK